MDLKLRVGGPDNGGGEIEGTSPDMLKNTPWNIRRLASEIEQCEGRQKYLAHTRSPSDGGDVRWYFCKVPLAVNELAASVPATEVVGKGDYFRFGMRDSLAVEAAFLQREDELLSCWWKEYSECSEGPRGTGVVPMSFSQKKELFSTSPESTELYAVEEERVGVPIKGGLYEVDLVRRHCFPVYWNGEVRRVLRGHWFARKGGLDWLPLREDISEQLEYAYRTQVWHRRTFQQSGLFAARVDLQGSTPGLHALFVGEDDTWEAWLNVDASGFSGVVGFGGNGIKLRRGFAPSHSQKPTQDELRQQKEEEMDDYCSQVPVRHLVFMVHGIGQRMEKSNLVDDVGDFRLVTANVAERHLTSHQLATQRVLYIPCQWRKGLALSGEAAVEKITLDGVRGLRTMLSATVHDILYYMSPIYCQEIIDSVSNQLNKLYLKFLKRYPGYDGKVSIYGHSLGSVLSYDILCHQQTLCSPFPMEWMYKEQKESDVACPVRNNLTPSNPIPNPRNNSSENVEFVNKGSYMDYRDLSEEPVERTFHLSPPASSESDELSSTLDIGYQQTIDALSLDENCNEPFCYSDHVDIPSSSKRTNFESCDDNTDDKAISDNKDETIKSLAEEISLLKSKLKELEADKVNGKKSATVENESGPERVQCEHTDPVKSYKPQIRYTKLEFKVDTFFAVGSPLGVFLSLRNIRIGIGKGKEYWKEENINEEMPACRQMFNIFHPFDPVAYRIEPLICKEYIRKPPIIIPYHRGGKRLYVVYREFKEGLATYSRAIADKFSTIRARALSISTHITSWLGAIQGDINIPDPLSLALDNLYDELLNPNLINDYAKVLTLCESGHDDGQDKQSENNQEEKERCYGSVMMDRLIGHEGGRIDHVLQDKTFRHPYVSAIGAHTNYWRDYDTALFMLNHLYRDVAEEPVSPKDPPLKGDLKDEYRFKGWSDPREAAEEELPLTFADGVSVKHFSFKVKKVMRR